MNKLLRIGLTGGIASGKSTVAEFFSDHSVPIIDTDIIARKLVEPNKLALDEIRSTFGNKIFDSKGRLDRRFLRKLVFSDSSQRKDLESILHPKISVEIAAQSEEAGGPYQIIIVPLLVESPMQTFMNRILVVDCDERIQFKRLLMRDSEDENQAHRIMAAQASRKERLAIADDIISNNDSLADTRNQVDNLHNEYLLLASELT
jgi:dephospho-CoA kinase